MDDEEVTGFLSSQSLGTLGLTTDDGPYLLPMSYGYNGGTSLYFYYVVADESRKADLSTEAETASFLVYSVETAFSWESVLLTGSLRKLPDEKRGDLHEDELPIWCPDLFETASEEEATQLYEFRVEEWTGIRHTGLPPGLAPEPSDPE